MSSSSSATPGTKIKKPKRKDLPAVDVRQFRDKLDEFLEKTDDAGRKFADSRWGVYAFYDYDGEPIYVGQTNELLRTRIRRHLTNQRTDAVAMRILDVFEVAEVEVWPLWQYQDVTSKSAADVKQAAKKDLDAHEYSAYLRAIERSRFKAILNEKIPPISETIALPESSGRVSLLTDAIREERGHADIRIARRAETIMRLAAVARERGEVSDGLRRVLVIQAVRLAYLSAERLAVVEGRDQPPADAIKIEALVGTVLYEHSDPHGLHRSADEEGDDVL